MTLFEFLVSFVRFGFGDFTGRLVLRWADLPVLIGYAGAVFRLSHKKRAML